MTAPSSSSAAIPEDAIPEEAKPGTDPKPGTETKSGEGARGGRLGGAVWVALLLVYVVWGSTYLGIRIALETMPPFLSAGSRFVCAGLILAAVVAWRDGIDRLRISRAQFGSLVLVGGLLITGGNGLVVLGEQTIPSGLAALLVAAVPLWMTMLSAAGGDRPRPMALAGVLVGLAGLAVLSAPAIGGSVSLLGVVSVIGATLTWAVGSFASKRIPLPGNVFAASAYQMVAGGLGSLLIGLVRGEQHGLDLGQVSGRSWLALGYLVVFGSLLGYTAYAWLLRSAPLTLASTYAYVNPVVAVVLGWLILSEPLTGPTIVGGAVVVVGVCLVISSTSRPGRPGR